MSQSPSPQSDRQRIQVYQRMLALTLHQVQQTGEFNFPPFVKLVEQWDQLSQEPSETMEQVSDFPFRSQSTAVDSRLNGIRTAVSSLQALSISTPAADVQQAIQSLAQETRLLELQFCQRPKASQPCPEDAQAALQVLRYVRVYLLAKYSDRHFLSHRGLRAEEPSVYEAHLNRCYCYLAALQNAANLLVELLIQDMGRDSSLA